MNALIGFLLGLIVGAVLVWLALHLIAHRESGQLPREPMPREPRDINDIYDFDRQRWIDPL